MRPLRRGWGGKVVGMAGCGSDGKQKASFRLQSQPRLVACSNCQALRRRPDSLRTILIDIHLPKENRDTVLKVGALIHYLMDSIG